MAPRHCYRFKAPCLLFPWGRAHPRGAGVGDGRAGCGGPPSTGAWTLAPGPAVLPARGHPAGSSHACTLALPRRVLGGVSGGPWLGGREGGFPSHLRGGDHPLPSPPQGRAPRSGRAAWPAPRPAEAVQVGHPGRGRGRAARVPSLELVCGFGGQSTRPPRLPAWSLQRAARIRGTPRTFSLPGVGFRLGEQHWAL